MSVRPAHLKTWIRMAWLRISVLAIAAFAAAFLIAMFLFSNRAEILHGFSRILTLWLKIFLLAQVFVLARNRWPKVFRSRAWGQQTFLAVASFAAAVPAAVIRQDRQVILRSFMQVFVFWLPIFTAVFVARMIHHWRRMLLFGASLALALIALDLVGPSIMHRYLLPFYDLSIDHRFRPKPGQFNIDGVEPDIPPDEYRASDFNIIFLGDSFTFGDKLENPWDAFPFVAERTLKGLFPDKKIRAADFGWRDASPLLEYRQFAQIGAPYKPKLVVQAIDMTDFWDDLHFRQQFRNQGWYNPFEVSIYRAMEVYFSSFMGVKDFQRFLLEKSYLVNRRGRPPGDPLSAILPKYYFAMSQPLADSEPYMNFTWSIILKTRKLAREMGADYALFILPRCQHYNKEGCPVDHVNFYGGQIPKTDTYIFEPFRFFEEKAKTVDFPIHSLLQDFRECGVFPTVIPGDDHYNENGHRIAGKAVAKYLVADGFFGPAEGAKVSPEAPPSP